MSNKLIFRKHAVQRMFERAISMAEVTHVLNHGQCIIDYPDDTPYPSRLILGWSGNRPIHVVAAESAENETIIVTVYQPDPALWEPGFERKKS